MAMDYKHLSVLIMQNIYTKHWFSLKHTGKVNDNKNSVFKHDRFLMSFQVFKSYIATFMFYILEVV